MQFDTTTFLATRFLAKTIALISEQAQRKGLCLVPETDISCYRTSYQGKTLCFSSLNSTCGAPSKLVLTITRQENQQAEHKI